jgi:hypothetical protein
MPKKFENLTGQKFGRLTVRRPSEPRDEHFEDFSVSVNTSKEGIFFKTLRSIYYKGIRVFVTFPFTSGYDLMRAEYLAEVTRV